MYPILTPEEMNRKLQVSYPVFLKTWYEYAMDADTGFAFYDECRRNTMTMGGESYFDNTTRAQMRADYTGYIKRCNYQFSRKDINAEKKTIAMMRAEFDKWDQEREIEKANRQAEREKNEAIVLGMQ